MKKVNKTREFFQALELEKILLRIVNWDILSLKKEKDNPGIH